MIKRHLEFFKTIGNELRGIREDKQIQLQEVAKDVGVSSTYISDIERNNKVPSVETIGKLAEVYGLERSRIFKGFYVIPPQMIVELCDSNGLYEILFELSEDETITSAQKAEFYREIEVLYKEKFKKENRKREK